MYMLLLLGQASKGNVPRVALITCLASFALLGLYLCFSSRCRTFSCCFFSTVQCPTPRYAAAASATVVAAAAGDTTTPPCAI